MRLSSPVETLWLRFNVASDRHQKAEPACSGNCGSLPMLLQQATCLQRPSS